VRSTPVRSKRQERGVEGVSDKEVYTVHAKTSFPSYSTL
jgi:hypothetical protein